MLYSSKRTENVFKRLRISNLDKTIKCETNDESVTIKQHVDNIMKSKSRVFTFCVRSKQTY